MQIQLAAKVTDPELLNKSINKEGTLFYQQDLKGYITRIVYFSVSRVIEYEGPVDQKLAELVRAQGYQADTIEMDKHLSLIRITQTSQ